jgi:hypothetical protein
MEFIKKLDYENLLFRILQTLFKKKNQKIDLLDC